VGQAYTPGLELARFTRVRKIRELPLQGKNLVSVGQRVKAKQAVLSAELPGDIAIVRVASRMGFDVLDVLPNLKVSVGQRVERGDLLCEIKSFFNLFTSRLASPCSGEIEFFTEANAHLGIRQASVPLEVLAYVDGHVLEIEEGKSVTIETEGTLIQGIFGVGGECNGEIFVLDLANDRNISREDIANVSVELSNKIIIGGAKYSIAALEEAAKRGAIGIVCGSIDSETLAKYVGYEIGVSITGDEEVPCTLMITEGFGQLAISDRVMELAKEVQGRSASLNGATQVRAGAMRPEIIVPRLDELSEQENIEAAAKFLRLGARLRIIRVPYFGELGEITELPHQPVKIPSGAVVRVLHAKLDSGQEVIVPRANVELL